MLRLPLPLSGRPGNAPRSHPVCSSTLPEEAGVEA